MPAHAVKVRRYGERETVPCLFCLVLLLTESCPRVRGIRAERTLWIRVSETENGQEQGELQAAAKQDDHLPTSVRGCECNEQNERGTTQSGQVSRGVPPQLRLRSAAPPASGGAFNSLSQTFRFASSLDRRAFWCALQACRLKLAPERGFEPSAPSGRCSEVRGASLCSSQPLPALPLTRLWRISHCEAIFHCA